MLRRGMYAAMVLLALVSMPGMAEDGYDLWLKYGAVEDEHIRKEYDALTDSYFIQGLNPETNEIIAGELHTAVRHMLGRQLHQAASVEDASLVIAVVGETAIPESRNLQDQLAGKPSGSFAIALQPVDNGNQLVVAGVDMSGALYGTFHLLRMMQMREAVSDLSTLQSPAHDIRILNHWDNLDRTVERGYAGFSIWDWHRLPEYIDPRYLDYARANASIGINATVLTNVNADETILRRDYLEKVRVIADVLRPYGIRVFLTARFSAPHELDGLATADPLNAEVRAWWKAKADEIYGLIPDFGGFLVKANSEGQPGPQDYGRSHADGANMLADAVDTHGGLVMWRAFVYSAENIEDRAKQAYDEFVPLDGEFNDNVLIQVKNGPIDFQPREPVHPMFGAMPETPLMMEFQITQEYLGQATHLVYLGPMYEEVLDFDTYAHGAGSTVASIVRGQLHNNRITGMAGVSNIGTDRNWTGHLFGQANWYVFGRLAWDPELSSGTIAEEWIRQTFSNDPGVVQPILEIMKMSHEACVRYMTPLGLHHIMGNSHHYGPGPWLNSFSRADWNPVYYHRADSAGIGFDRTATGSKAVSQYFEPVRALFASPETCPEKYLLWFHHVEWSTRLPDGQTLWEALCREYDQGVGEVRRIQDIWQSLSDSIDHDRHQHVSMLLARQLREAIWWRDACIRYFQSISQLPIPEDVPQPEYSLRYYQRITHPYAPGNLHCD